jgi:hypothetical protein
MGSQRATWPLRHEPRKKAPTRLGAFSIWIPCIQGAQQILKECFYSILVRPALRPVLEGSTVTGAFN